MDELLSKIYLSRWEIEHDLCIDENKYCHVLYDTIDFVLYQVDVPEIDLLAEISLFIEDRREVNNDGHCYVTGKYAGFHVYIDRTKLKICGSLCKHQYGVNMHDFPLWDVKKAIEKIGEDLHIPIGMAVVQRIDLAVDIEFSKSPAIYFSQMLGLSKFEKTIFPASVSFKTGTKELLFYDKGIEQGISDVNIGRYEFRIKKPKKFFKLKIVASMLYDPKFWNALLEESFSYYSKIKKERTPFPIDKVVDIRSLIKFSLRSLIHESGYIELLALLKCNKVIGTLTPRNHAAIVKKIKNICSSSQINEACPEIEEFSHKLRRVLDSKKVVAEEGENS